jgi:hypothetical protein
VVLIENLKIKGVKAGDYMNCPLCGADLVWHDYYGKMKYANHYYLYPQSWIEKTGDIYKCPNSEWFKDLEQAREYRDNNYELIV